MYFDDTPIKTQEQDLLNRKNFSKRLAKGLVETTTKEGYCIGLYGPWGSGKSSIVNMTIEEVELLSETIENPPIVMLFNPWNFSSKDQLLKQYFVMLADKFCNHKIAGLHKIGKELLKYSGMLEPFGTVGKVLSFGGKAALSYITDKNENLDNNISKQRDDIVKALQEQECKVIIVIDDIDRLTNEEIRLVFQLVNSVAKFPNTIYLLSFDKEVVAEALSDVQSYDGEKYLEKIIQVPIHIPEAPKAELWDILFERLDLILKSHEGMTFDKDLWSQAFYNYISKYIKHVRDVIRLTNTLTIKCDMIGTEVNFIDMVVISMIENKLPRLYKWIKDNKGLLVESNMGMMGFGSKSEKERVQLYKDAVSSIDPRATDEHIRLLRFLFPYFSAQIDGHSYYRDKNSRRMLRIGNDDVFDRYFVLDMNDGEISRTELDLAMQQMTEDELEQYMAKINSNGGLINFLKELEVAIMELSEDRSELLVKVLLNNAYGFEGKSSKGWFSLPASEMSIYKARDLLLCIDNVETRKNILKELIKNANLNSIQTISQFVNIIELAHGRLAANGQENGGEKVITTEQLEELEVDLLAKIKMISEEISLLDLDQSRMVLYLYKSLDSTSYEEYMRMQLENDLNRLKYLAFSVHKWISGSEITWECQKEYEELLTEDDLDNAFDICLENKKIWNLKEENLHQAVAFRYFRYDGVDWDGKISDKEVAKKVMALKSK